MSDITPERKMIQQEETKPQAAVTESVLSRVGGGINFINTRHVYQHDWNLNGQYSSILITQGMDSIITYPFAFEIADVALIVGAQNGSSGQAEVDIKWRPENSGSFQSIFSTTPKFTYQASPFSQVRIGLAVPFMTTPTLSKTTFSAYDQIRMDLLTAPSGDVEGLFLKVWIRPI